MGTTVTSNLGLIKPDINDYIKANLPTYAGWAAQNAINMDKIDYLFRANAPTYTPTWTASSVNPTLGATGFTEGKYLRIYPRMVIGFIRLYAGGAGFAPGTGTYNVSIPVAMASELRGFNTEFPIGKACFYDDSAVATSSVFNVVYSIAGDSLVFKLPTNDLWTAASPVALAQQDRLSAYYMYPTSVA